MLLAAVILFGFVACGGGGSGDADSKTPSDNNSENTSRDNSEYSGDNSQDSSEDTSEDSSGNPGEVKTFPIDSVITGNVDRTKEKVSLSIGKTYQSDFKASDIYPDSGGELTDGKTGEAGFYGEWSGYELKGSADIAITIDLGEVFTNIADLQVSFLAWKDCGIAIPPVVEFQVSTDGENYISVGKVYNDQTPMTLQKVESTLKLGKTVKGRYVKVIIEKSGVWWLFMEEIGVYSYGDGTGETQPSYDELGKKLYTSEPIKKVTTEVFWDASEPDYKDTINLVAGLTQRVYVPVNLSGFYATNYKNSEANSPLLTDGKKASSVWGDGWFRSVHGIERNVVFDLQKTSSVSHVVMGIGHSGGAGIYLPRYIRIWLSDNGVDWQQVYADNDPQPHNAEGRMDYRADFGKKYKARFINIQFGVSCFVYIDEIEVYGTKFVGSDAAALKPTGSYETQFPDEYIKPDKSIYNGATNILLAPYIQNAASPNAGITRDIWLPYIAYLDKDGKIKDTMFDGVVMAAYGVTFDQGYNPTTVNNYIDYLFAADLNLNSLEKTVGEVKKALGLNDYKVAVVIAMPGTFNRDYTPGDYDGDGKIERFDTFEDLKKITDWFMNRCEALFANQNYQNIVLTGYYWPPETVEYHKPFEEQLIKYTSDKCHEKGYSLSFIPWLRATGYQEWKELGFDVVNMQPNYPWYDFPIEIVAETADEAKKLGMSVEIEIHPSAMDSAEYFAKYIEYLDQGVKKGYKGTILFYYQGGMPGEYYKCYKGEGKYSRLIYDYTYQFIKGKYTIQSLSASDMEFDIPMNKTFKGSFGENTDKNLIYTIDVSPVYGSVKSNGDGTFTYYPLKDYTGTVTFTYTVSNGSDAATGTITLNIN